MESGFKRAFHAIALALDEDRFGMVEKAVKNGRSQGGIVVKDLRPLSKGAVRGNDNGTPFVAEADDLEEQICAAFVDGQEPELVQTEQGRSEVSF